jgi:hypothetical protein
MNGLKTNVDNYITSDMVNSIEILRTQLKTRINQLESKYGLPKRGEPGWYDKLIELGGTRAEELERTYWVFDEVRNIESSFEEIDRALAEPALDTEV